MKHTAERPVVGASMIACKFGVYASLVSPQDTSMEQISGQSNLHMQGGIKAASHKMNK